MSDYSAAILALTPSFYFRMDEASGHLVDAIAANNTTAETALTYGAAGAIVGDPGTAISFNGTTSFATAPSAAAFDFVDGPMTVMAWLKVADTGVNRIAFDRGHATGNAWMLHRKTTNAYALVDSTGGTVICSAPANTDTTSYHLVGFDKNGATSHFYFDGKDVTVAGTNVTLSNSTGSLFIGEQAAFAFWSGLIDEFAGFASVLSPAAWSNLYVIGKQLYVPAIQTFDPTDVMAAA